MHLVPATTEQAPLKTEEPRSARSQFVDGLRALCALFVVEHHIFYELYESKQWALLDPLARSLTGWLKHGYISVAGFIVLSGFCLMLPVVAQGRLGGGIRGFLFRRARRILPPYYAALAFSLLLLAVVPGFAEPSGYHWDWSLPAFKRSVIVSHLFLVHNLNAGWVTKINHPLWSIAIEWQIYFVFAFVLVPLRRKLDLIGGVAAAFILGAIPGVVFHTGDWTRPWYLGLFSLGMVSATIVRSNHPAASTLRNKVPWGALTAALVLCEVYFAASGSSMIVNEFVAALVIMSCLIWGSSFDLGQTKNMIGYAFMKLLTARSIVGIGVFSYSIYLIHAPIIALLRMWLISMNLPATTTYGLLLVFGTVFSVLGGYGLFLLVERHFLSKAETTAPKSAVS